MPLKSLFECRCYSLVYTYRVYCQLTSLDYNPSLKKSTFHTMMLLFWDDPSNDLLHLSIKPLLPPQNSSLRLS